jgi:hypothetical protein
MAALTATRGTDGWLEDIAHGMDFRLQNLTRVQHRGENLCTPIQRPRTYSLSQGLLNHASIRQNRELYAYALENIIGRLLETAL